MIEFDKTEVFLVTGGNSGIGKEIALLLNKLGATVIAAGRNIEKLQMVRSEATDRNTFHIEQKDLEKDIDTLNEWQTGLVEKYGKMKGLVLAAGISYTLPIKAVSLKKSRKLFDINFFSNLMLCKGFASQQIDNDKGASIVLISSITALTGGIGLVDYSASKAALCAMTKSLAKELGKDGIRVNTVLPGYVLTDMIKKDKFLFNKNFINKINEQYILGIGKASDIAPLVCFLLSSCANWITGSNIVIDGGGTL